MWPFASRRPRIEREELPKQPESDFNFAPFKINDVYIKLWLPEKITTALDRLSVEHEVSRPDVLRWIFFEHVYGRDLFVGLQESLKLPQILFSRKRMGRDEVDEVQPTARSVDMEYLGKSTEDIKLWLPTPLKDGLQELAKKNKQGLSDYLRAVLARHLFGERFYAEWQQALAAINQQAARHEA